MASVLAKAGKFVIENPQTSMMIASTIAPTLQNKVKELKEIYIQTKTQFSKKRRSKTKKHKKHRKYRKYKIRKSKKHSKKRVYYF